MRKLGLLALFLPIAVVAAGLFGALHDQISFTVSEEYFTRFKFLQFGLVDEAVPPRVRAAGVGFLASWWMGIPFGLAVGAVGFIHATPKRMWQALTTSIAVAFAFTLTFALFGLLYGYVRTQEFDLGGYGGWYIADALQHPRRFVCAGYMHNAAYIGGILAVPIAWISHVVMKYQDAYAS